MGHIKCKKCGILKTYPEFKFTGKGKSKSGKKGAYRKDICLRCEK